MAIYTIYNTLTGQILSVQNCRETVIDQILGPDEAYLEGEVDTVRYDRVVDGAPVEAVKEFYPVEYARFLRNARLQDSDWTQVPDSPLTEAEKIEWAAYRQELRDVPQSVDFSECVSKEDVEALMPVAPGE